MYSKYIKKQWTYSENFICTDHEFDDHAGLQKNNLAKEAQKAQSYYVYTNLLNFQNN